MQKNPPSESRMSVKKRKRSGRILDAAFDCFDEYGFKNTTMAMIADKADMSVGSLYNYHGTKEELLLNGIFSTRDDYAEEIATLANNNFTCEEHWIKLTGIYLASFSRYSKRVWREFMATIFSEATERMNDIREIDLPFIAGIQEILKTYPLPNSSLDSAAIEKTAQVIYQLWLQSILQYMLSESMSVEVLQYQFLEELGIMGFLD